MSKLPSVSELIVGAQLHSLHNSHSPRSSSRSNSDASPRQAPREPFLNSPPLELKTFAKPSYKPAGTLPRGVAYTPHYSILHTHADHSHPAPSYHGRDYHTAVSPGAAAYYENVTPVSSGSEFHPHYTSSYGFSTAPVMNPEWAAHRDGYFPRHYSQSSQSSQSSLSSYRGDHSQHGADALSRVPLYSHFAPSEPILKLESRSPGVGSPVLHTRSKPRSFSHGVPYSSFHPAPGVPSAEGQGPFAPGHQVAFTVHYGGVAGNPGPVAAYPHIPPQGSRTARNSISDQHGHGKNFGPSAMSYPAPHIVPQSHNNAVQSVSPPSTAQPSPNAGCVHSEPNHALVNKRSSVKRRTRTGCLTCRKRRIKCDERKPFCTNCERSKKVCLGYEALPTKKGHDQKKAAARSSVHDLIK